MNGWPAILEALERPPSPEGRARRAALAPLLAIPGETPADAAESRALELLGAGERAVLVSGQQAGLCLGPFLLLSKCLGLLALADRAEAAGAPRPLTIFWMEGNDHDWREAATPGRPLPDGWSAPAPVGMDGRSVGRIPAPVEWWTAQRTALAPLLSVLDPGLGRLADSALQGSLTDHSRQLLRALFAGSGLLILDPARPALRRLAAPFLERLQDNGSELARMLQEQTEALRAAGRPTPVKVDERPPWFFENAAGVRTRAEPGQREPVEACSPNVLTRPLLQDWLLEPATVLLGPSEMAYTAQAESAREWLGIVRPLPLARPTLQLARRADLTELRALGLDPWLPPQAGQAWPEDWLLELEGGATLHRQLAEVTDAGGRLSALCAASGRPDLEQLAKRQDALQEQMCQALWSAHKARHKEQLRHLHGLAAWQDGAGAPQERRVNALALLARMEGEALLDGLRRELDPLAATQQRFVCEPDGRVQRAELPK